MQNNAGFINMNQGIYNQNKNNNNVGMGMDINNFNINNNNIEASFNYGGISNNGQIMNNRYNMIPQVIMNHNPNVNINHSFIHNNQINKNVNMTNNISNNVSQRLFNSQTYLTGIHMNQNQNQRLNTVTMQNQNQNQILNSPPLQNQNQNQILNSSPLQNQNQNQILNSSIMQNQNQNQMVNAFQMQNQNQNQMLNLFPMNKQTSMQEVLFKKNLNYNNFNFVNQNQNNNINGINNEMNIPSPNLQNNMINFQQNQHNQFLNLNQLNVPILNPNPVPPPVKRQGGMKAILPRNIVSIDAPHRDQNTEMRNLKFDASTGIRIVIKVPIYTTVEKALEEFVKRIGLNKDVIGKDLIFLFNGSQMDIHSQELVENYQDFCSITVFDKNNVIGAY